LLAKPKKKVSKTSLRNKCDLLASRYYRALTPYCELAGKDDVACGGPLQWCHIIGRANLRLRYEPYNNLICCAGHHRFYGLHPVEWVRILEKEYPERLTLAEQHRHEVIKVDYFDWIQRFSEIPEVHFNLESG
jgi:hypothetical protein